VCDIVYNGSDFAVCCSGPFKRGAHAFHSWNVVTTETKERLIVDLVFAPGVVYVEGSEEARQYQCRDEYAFSSLCQ